MQQRVLEQKLSEQEESQRRELEANRLREQETNKLREQVRALETELEAAEDALAEAKGEVSGQSLRFYHDDCVHFYAVIHLRKRATSYYHHSHNSIGLIFLESFRRFTSLSI